MNKHNADRLRVTTERAVARRIIRDALAAGCKVSVHDGEEWVVKQTESFATAFQALFSTDSDTIAIRRADGSRIGTVLLVYGNDGWDVISDYTMGDGMEALLKGAHEVAAKFERRAA